MKSCFNGLSARPHGAWMAVLLLAFACTNPPDAATGTRSAEAVAPADELLLASARVALPPPGLRTTDLPDPAAAGAQSLNTFCTSCHALPSPAMHSATDWPGVVRRMWLRMDLIEPTYGVRVPELGERIVLLDYLVANALVVSQATLPDLPGRTSFETTCAQCHELPDPRQHSGQDWFVVVRRMNEHMRTILGKELTGAEIEKITGFLTATTG